jgi:DNA repair photolyase
MAKVKRIEIITDTNEKVTAQAPFIISASRSTDIPAFYAEWFKNRWRKGYIKWINPFNQKPVYVSFKNAKVVVFWTKNPKPMMKKEYIDFLKKEVKNFYFQYTLNDYDKENFEEKVPPLKNRIEIFKELSNLIGKEKVIWRFDPLILTDKVDVKELLKRIKNIGDQLHNYTEKLVFSFADISVYRKVQNNLKNENINYIEFDTKTMEYIAEGLEKLNKKWNIEIATCSEKIDLDKFAIKHNKCIDDDLMIKLFPYEKELMEFLGVEFKEPDLFSDNQNIIMIRKEKKLKDEGQRLECGCIKSKDIGQYNTCPHGCLYCYANTSKKIAYKNYNLSKSNQNRETILPDKF